MKNYQIVFTFILVFLFLGCDDRKQQSEEKTLTVITPNFYRSLRGPILEESKQFEQETGTTIQVISPGFNDLVKKMKESLHDDKINYDVFVTSSWGASILYQNALEIPKWVKEKTEWDDLLPVYKKNTLLWDKKYYFLPYDGDSLNLYYRKDLFVNKEYKQRFQKEFGYELDVPKTWKEYNDIAKFFNGWDWDNDGKIEYGFAESRIKNYGMTLLFLTKAAAYAKYPTDKFYYFDPDTMKPRINNPAFVKALEEFIDIMQYAPEQTINYTALNVRRSFMGGDVALIIDWSDAGLMAQNSKESLIKDKVGFAKLPGSSKVYNSHKKQWENMTNTPASLLGTWTIAVNKNSKNKKLALEFASYMCSKEITNKYVVKGWSGINPSRYSHLKLEGNLKKWEENGFNKAQAKEYLDAISDSVFNTNVVVDLRIPGTYLYYKVLTEYLYQAINKELSPKKALDQVAKEWEKITTDFGREKQKKLYKGSIS